MNIQRILSALLTLAITLMAYGEGDLSSANVQTVTLIIAVTKGGGGTLE
jgi:hypothetical protein